MIKEEFKNILQHKILIATIIGIMFIPFLYSVFFLKSVWDPYGNTQYLPVAVVNEDKTVYYQGKKFAVGSELVKELKKNNDLDWHFVSAKKAQYGLSHKKYYMVLTIPKNFSKNATTVLDKEPKKMELTYNTNDSLNYIGQVISQEGAKQIKAQIRENVTTAYANTMFTTIKKVGSGFSKAADGAKQLSDGTVTLSDGLNVYTAGVGAVNDGVVKLKMGVTPLASGVLQLTNGADALASGLGQLNANSQKLTSGAAQLQAGIGQLNQVATSQQVKDMLSQLPGLLDKAGNLSQTAQQYLTPQNIQSLQVLLNAGQVLGKVDANQLQSTLQALETLKQDPAIQQLLQIDEAQLNDLQNKVTVIASLLEQTSGLQNNLTQALNAFKATIIPTIVQNGQTLTQEQVVALLQGLNDQAQAQKFVMGLASGQITVTSDSAFGASINSVLRQVKAGNIAQDKFPTVIADVMSGQAQVLQKQLTLYNGVKQTIDPILATLQSNFKPADLQKLQAQIKLLQAVLAKKQDLLNILNTIKGFNLSQQDLQTLLTAQKVVASSEMQAQIKQLQGQMGNLQNIQAQIVKYSQMLPQIKAQTQQIQQLPNGVQQLFAGSSQLASGLNTYTAGVGSAYNGSTQLAGGLNTLNAQVPTLTSGINQLADGTQQLVANSGKLVDGALQLKDGNKTLADSLKDGAKTVNSIKLTNKNAEMFAAPANLKHKNYSKVQNYGYALAPYMLSVALYVGALVFNLVYPLRRLSTPDGTATQWFASKVAIGSLVAIGNALVEMLLMMAAGLHPQHVGSFLINGISFSLTAMFLIMVLSMALGNPGRFLGMIFLVIQLGSCGGSFPIEITRGMNGFFQAINPYLPMTYSVYGFRQALNSGLGASQITTSVLVQVVYIIVCLGLLWIVMSSLRSKTTYVESPENFETDR